jgi:hypothetical protein
LVRASGRIQSARTLVAPDQSCKGLDCTCKKSQKNEGKVKKESVHGKIGPQHNTLDSIGIGKLDEEREHSHKPLTEQSWTESTSCYVFLREKNRPKKSA